MQECILKIRKTNGQKVYFGYDSGDFGTNLEKIGLGWIASKTGK